MELRLSKFIEALEQITDIHNQDHANPAMLNIPHPARVEGTEQTGLQGQMFRMVVSQPEPNYLGLPINGIWICMKHNSIYYRQALKLKATVPPAESGVAGVITDGGFDNAWVVVKRYDNLFNEQQITGEGSPGPDGRKNITYIGDWTSTRRYSRGQGVMESGSFYVSNIDNNGVKPEVGSTSWQLMARVGSIPEVDYGYILDQMKNRLSPPQT